MFARSASVPAAKSRPGALARAVRHISVALAVRRHRLALARLEPHLLRDIGLSEAEARVEADRSVWDVPSHWRG